METRKDEERLDLNDEGIGLTDIKLVSFSDNIIGYNTEKIFFNKKEEYKEK